MIKHIYYRLIIIDYMPIKSAKILSHVWFYPSHELVACWKLSASRCKLLYDKIELNRVFQGTYRC